MNIAVLSDIHGSTRHLDAVRSILEQCDLILLSGDLSASRRKDSAKVVLNELEQLALPILAVHGNWDDEQTVALLAERNYLIHGRGKVIGRTGFFGVGGSNRTPMKTPTEYGEEEIDRLLEEGYLSLAAVDTIVLVSHVPPKSVRDRTFLGIRAGSSAVRRCIDSRPISFCVCGHIHEGRGIERMDRTLVMNAGSFRRGWFGTIDTESGQANLYKTGMYRKLKRRFAAAL